VQGKAQSARPVALRVREGTDQVCAVMVEDLAQESVRRQVFFASLPDGRCLTAERLMAREDVTLERVEQGFLSVINDGYFGDRGDLEGRRRLFWAGGERVFRGYVSGSEADDEVLDLGGTGWVNVDDRFGFVFRGSGRALYHNRHFFKRWRAVEDTLILSLRDAPQAFRAGDRIAELVALWCPEQAHGATETQTLILREAPADAFAAEVDGFLCACAFEPVAVTLHARGCGAAGADLKVRLDGYEPVVVALG
jgi:hypothetical protein